MLLFGTLVFIVKNTIFSIYKNFIIRDNKSKFKFYISNEILLKYKPNIKLYILIIISKSNFSHAFEGWMAFIMNVSFIVSLFNNN
jgi:hypothetical protein